MSKTEKTIEEHFNQPKIIAVLNELANKYFSNEKRVVFLNQITLIKSGDFFVGDLMEFLTEEFDYKTEQASLIDKELYDNVFQDVYIDLIDLYIAKNKNLDLEHTKKEPIENPEIINTKDDKFEETNFELSSKIDSNMLLDKTQEDYADLPTIYQTFVASSFFQNILAAEKRVAEEASGDEVKFKNLFYQAINGGDKIRFCGILRQIFNSGVHNFFNLDQRYSSFMQNFLNNQPDKKDLEEFKTNPAQRKFIILFLRLILEKKMGVAAQDSAMIGTGLAALAAKNNESEYAEMAYGDEEQNKFVWSD